MLPLATVVMTAVVLPLATVVMTAVVLPLSPGQLLGVVLPLPALAQLPVIRKASEFELG